MRIVTNTRLAERNRKIATNLFLITFVLLIGGFIFINVGVFTGNTAKPDPLLLLAQGVAIPVAFILTLFSIRMTNLWARRPYPDESLNEGLKGLSKKSVIYHYYHIPARHVLIAPQGVFAITTRWQNGKYEVDGDRWTTNANPITRLFAMLRMDGVGQPSNDAKHAAEHVQKLLRESGADINVTVQPLIVFLDPKAEVKVKNDGVPVVFTSIKHDNSLTDYLRSLNKGVEMTKKGAVMPLTEQQIASFEALTIDKAKATIKETA
jgi:hypothetical protein